VPVLARVDDRGIYTPVLRANTTESFTTTLVANRGEWRIRSVPPGLLLSTTSFENRYRATPLYFSDPAGKALVPDVRWFPLLDQPSATTALVVAALLKGPVPWLADAVQSGVVPGTTLTALAPVRIDGSTVRIDLSASARDATPQQRVVLQSELLASLQSLETLGLPSVADVVVTQDQARYDVPEVPGPTVQSDPARETTERPQREAGAQGAPLCIAGGDHVGRLANGSMCAPSPGLDALAQPGIRLPATDPSGTVFAVLAGGGTRVLAASAGKPAEVVGRGQALTAPSVDAAGWVWSVPASPGPTIVLGGVNHTPAPVDVRWLVGAQVLSLRVSPEGIRAVVVLRRAGRAQVVVAAIRRDNDGRPLALVPDPLDLLPDATTVVDAGWADAQTVDVLAGRPAADGAPADGKTYAWQVTVGGGPGLAVADPVGPDAVGLAVGGDRVDLFVRTANGKALERALGGWRSIDVLDPTLPG
jgi:hypothetical protein